MGGPSGPDASISRRSVGPVASRSSHPGPAPLGVRRPTAGRRTGTSSRRGERGGHWRRRSPWLDVASANRPLAVPPLDNQRRVRERGNDGIMPVLARTVREVEAAVQRGRVMPSVRTKFQVVALLAREERARVRADETSSESQRTEQLKRLDGIAMILAQTAARDTSLLSLLAEDAVVSDAAKSLRRDMLRDAGLEAAAEEVAPPEPAAASAATERRVVPQSVISRQLANPFLAPDFSAARQNAPAAAPPGQLGAARPALQLVRPRRRRHLGLHGAAPAVLPAGAGWLAADAAPGAGGRRRRRRPPDLPARRRAGPGQDGAGAARRAGSARLPAARRRTERRQDQLGPRGRPLDTQPGGHRDPRQRRHHRRLRRHRHRQLRGARPPRRVDRRPGLPRHGRRRGALHQEQVLPALAARAGALRAHPVPHQRAPC